MDYKEKKSAKLAKLMKIGDQIIWERSKFDPETGQFVKKEILQFDLNAYKAEREILASKLQELDDMIADAEALFDKEKKDIPIVNEPEPADK